MNREGEVPYMNHSKKILAALVAIPASVVVAGGVQAEEITSTFEIKNDFLGNATYTNQPSTKLNTATTEAELKEAILSEMAEFRKGFTVTLTGEAIDTYKNTVEDTFNVIKEKLNKRENIRGTAIDYSVLFGVFNNVRVKATETMEGTTKTSVKLEFSFNYFTSKEEVAALKSHHTKILIPTGANEIVKVKAVHDYIITNTTYKALNHRLLPNNGLSSHGYSLWAYTLLKELLPNNEVRYVHGVANGEYRSWNIVNLDGKWYSLDVAADDPDSGALIKYEHFLTYTPFERSIRFGSETSITVNDEKYNYFKTINTQAMSKTHIYYASSENSGELYQLDLTTLEPKSIGLAQSIAFSGSDRIVYYEQSSGDAATIVSKYLYFINDSQGKYLYRYNLLTKPPLAELLLKEPLQFIKKTGTTLIYKPITGEESFVPLDATDQLDKEKADKVFEEVQKLEEIADKTTSSFKTKVMEVRQMYMALTPAQKAQVPNYATLQQIESDLTKGSVSSKYIIDLISQLDEMEKEYVQKVEAAYGAYNRYGNEQDIYNRSILLEAVQKIEKATLFKKKLDEKINSLPPNGEPFEEIADFINFIENLLTEYDSYLPSIRNEVGINANAIEQYRNRAAQLRNETKMLVNEVKSTNENALDFLVSMDLIKAKYESLLISQLHIINGSDKTIVNNKLQLAVTMKEQVTRFNNLMANVPTGGASSIALTPELVAQIKEAQSLYIQMKPAQKTEIEESDKSNLSVIMNRITGIATHPFIKEFEKTLLALNINDMVSLEGLKEKVASADSANIVVEKLKEEGFSITKDELMSLVLVEAKTRLEAYRKLSENAGQAQIVKADMGALTSDASVSDIEGLRGKYEALDPQLQKFFTAELAILEAQEKRIENNNNEATVKAIMDEIAHLTEATSLAKVNEVKVRFDSLTPALQQAVENKDHLLILWTKLSNGVEAIQKAIDEVNKAIEALTSRSSKEDVEKVVAAYNKLNTEQKEQVENYGKVELLLEALEALETEFANKAAADKVIEMIPALHNESTPAEISAARAAYNNLSVNAKKLISERMLENLVYFEKLLETQTEQAKKEAKTVMDRISRIDNTRYSEEQIKSVRMAYMALSELAKTFVTNLNILIDAENFVIYQNTVVKQAKLDANAFDLHMNTINRNSSTAEIAKARSLYNNLAAVAKRYVTTLEKLVRLETMWNDPQYIELVHTYYPDYVNAVKPGAIVIEKPTYDPLYIPDDSPSTRLPSSVATSTPKTATWSPYETMTYQNGRYTTQITASQVKNISDRNMRLKAGEIEIVIPTTEIQSSTATVGVSLSLMNNQLNIQFTEGNNPKTFSSIVEVYVPISSLKANAAQVIERVVAGGKSPASFKIDGANFVIRTSTSGTFKAVSSNIFYTDIQNNEQGQAIRELAKRGITFNTTGRLVQSSKQVSKLDVSMMITTALDLSSNAQSKYLDIDNSQHLKRAQGLLEAGIMTGATSSRFAPNTTVTKQEAAIIIANMYRYLNQDLSKVYNELTSNYRDIANLTLEARQSIAILELFGIVDGTGAFNPTQTLSRGEFAELFYKALSAIDYL